MNGAAMAEEIAELSDLKVMVIDDSKTIRRTAENLLKKEGLLQKVFVDCAHGNSQGKAQRQKKLPGFSLMGLPSFEKFQGGLLPLPIKNRQRPSRL